VNLTAEQVLDKRFTLSGIKDLEEKMAELPTGSTITWVDQLMTGGGPDIKRKETFAYPPSKMIKEIKRCAELHNIRIDMVKGSERFTVPGVGAKR
jgi:hypothetical protein